MGVADFLPEQALAVGSGQVTGGVGWAGSVHGRTFGVGA